MKKALAMLFLLVGCVKAPHGVSPVKEFKLDRYLGKWYEIARLDHSFERGLAKVSATYSMRDDGGVKVINKGYLEAESRWKEAEGRAYFVKSPDVGFLKVSFFGPFYGSYVVIDLDKENYNYSLVCGPSRDYLWILSRTTTISDGVKARLIDKAKAAGFPTEKLIWVEQE
ncbi:MAG TPA: lipocalin family protein [Acidobacteriota bacterium]|jgi:apolipoprotein D and lipocalin family protein|nr:lipocalin family protein [Acidobacteriota bacterium]HQQ47552.1 lipocalin family protein [Acidobacteriota bacterium]